jgi:hypothetical protein
MRYFCTIPALFAQSCVTGNTRLKKNDHATQKPNGHIFGLGLWSSYVANKTHQIDTKSNLQKRRNGVWTVGSRIWCFFRKCIHFIYRKYKSPVQKTTTPRGNFPDIFLGLGLWSSCGAKKTLKIDTKSNPQWNQTNDVWTVCSRNGGFTKKKYYLYTERRNRQSKKRLFKVGLLLSCSLLKRFSTNIAVWMIP